MHLTDVPHHGPTWCVDPTGRTSCHYPPITSGGQAVHSHHPWPGLGGVLLCSHAFCFLSGEGEKHVSIISVHDVNIIVFAFNIYAERVLNDDGLLFCSFLFVIHSFPLLQYVETSMKYESKDYSLLSAPK